MTEKCFFCIPNDKRLKLKIFECFFIQKYASRISNKWNLWENPPKKGIGLTTGMHRNTRCTCAKNMVYILWTEAVKILYGSVITREDFIFVWNRKPMWNGLMVLFCQNCYAVVMCFKLSSAELMADCVCKHHSLDIHAMNRFMRF